MAKRSQDAVRGIEITHPDKAMWPATRAAPAVTKRELAEYYLAVAPRMLPHIAGRPISVVRAPDGIEGPRFFQRHASRGSGAREISVPGEARPFLAVETVEELVGLAQVAVLEIHPWGSRRDAPDTPERLIIDLDPAPDLDFAAVIAAAKEVRGKLMAFGLEPFVKTTGGKGLHVVAPVRGTKSRPLDWPTLKDFARGFCAGLAADAPGRYAFSMAKKERTGRIFLDYLRNDRSATAVAPWSPRARPGAPIAMPVPWAKLRAGFDPRAFDIAAAARLLRLADPWKDMSASAAAIPAAAEKRTR